MKRTRVDAEKYYKETLKNAEKDGCLKEVMGYLGKNDLYYLLVYLLNRKDICHDWMYERCKEVQEEPNFMLDLWAREHRKSTIITFALTIQDIINDPEITICIFSITRPIAKAFLGQIKKEFEDNNVLKWLYSDVLYEAPKKESDSWSEDKGINVKRKKNPKEHTLEAFGFIEGLPTSRHYNIRIYDDSIDQEHVRNSEIIAKAVNAWELSLSLGSDRVLPRYGVQNIDRYIGTRYHYNDIYRTIEERKAAKVRKRACTDNGKPDGKSVYFPQDLLTKKLKLMGTYTAACQMFLDPKQDSVNGFNIQNIGTWFPEEKKTRHMNRYLLVDPASKKNATSDYTSMLVVGLGEDGNIYLIDGVRDRLGLNQRTVWLNKLHRKWQPIKTGYEEYGLQADIEHHESVMEDENYRFKIIPLGGTKLSKTGRIERIIPDSEDNKIYFPVKIPFLCQDGTIKDLVQIILSEMDESPFGMHDDTIDCFARIKDPDLGAVNPKPRKGVSPSLAKKARRSSVTTYNALDI